MPRLGQRSSRSACLSGAADAAKPCARLVQERRLRAGSPAPCAVMRSRYAMRGSRLRSRMRSVTSRTRGWRDGRPAAGMSGRILAALAVLGLVAFRLARAGAEQELLHLRLQELAGLGLDGRQPVLVDEHGLMLQPTGPGLARNALVDSPPELPGIGRPVETGRLAFEHYTLHRSGHVESSSQSKSCGWYPAAPARRSRDRK